MNVRIGLLAALLICSGPAFAEEPAPAPGDGATTLFEAPAAPAASLPAMNFVSSVARDELYELIRSHDAFGKLEKELYGSPIVLRISHTLQPTAKGTATGLLSAIWSGGTLGLLPVVTNNSFVVTYEVLVQGKEVAAWSYQRSFTRAINIWAKDDATYGLGKDGLEWLKSTAAEFAAASASDGRLAALKAEYDRYFGELTAP